MEDDRILKWRLILGSQSDPNDEIPFEEEDLIRMDEVLEGLYDSDREAGLGSASPNVNRWLGDIRKFFPSSVVQIMQKDALERLDLEEMLLEPELLETLEVDASLVAVLISLKKVLPEKTKETARMVVQKLVKQMEAKLRNALATAIRGSLNKAVNKLNPTYSEINWHKTIRANLKHYQKDYQSIIPEKLIGYGKKGTKLKRIFLVVDQSGSMSTSFVYAGILGAILASLNSIKTHLIAFSTTVVDLSDQLTDPVELLFSAQLGGGTDINNALSYVQKLIHNPNDSILILISDLFEGGNTESLYKKIYEIKKAGVHFISLLALTDQGMPSFDGNTASYLASINIPAFACTPDRFPDLMAAAIKKEDLRIWAAKNEIIVKN